MNDFRQIHLVMVECLLFNDETSLRSLRHSSFSYALKFNRKEFQSIRKERKG